MNQPSRSNHPVPGQSKPPASPVSQCVVSFGSNLGERRELISSAAQQLAQSGLVLPDTSPDFPGEPGGFRTSRLFETPPIGGPGGQEPFLNAIGAFQTQAPAREVLDFLQQLELDLGRQRLRRWDSRSIDLDVVLHGRLVGGATGLVVPHPRYTARQFVLQPACDVARHFRDPRFGWTLGELTEHLTAAQPSMALVSGSQELRNHLCSRLSDEHSVQVILPGGKPAEVDRPWVSSFLPKLPKPSGSVPDPDQSHGGTTAKPKNGPPVQPGPREELSTDHASSLMLPRLLVRLHKVGETSQWPAPHLMWPSGWQWPEYRLEIDDLDWAVSELASAIDSMQCTVSPVTEDGNWWA